MVTITIGESNKIGHCNINTFTLNTVHCKCTVYSE